ncbi:hypothetical protein SAV14893_026820 [Streptomyces avermitilis]|uniref:Uncharacterized protein n=1 Tax=Streptomyces avermitilis TaxID=33903 RepID=A0A4D4LYX5_STRAX|nr:hypothetical protein SAV14893_026820 [Streptomyces avermitilis]
MLKVAGGGAGHGRAQLFGRDGGGIGVGDQPAVVDHPEGVREADQLVQVGRDEQDGQALAAGLADLVPDRGLRADVHTAGGVGGDQEARVVAHLAADDQLLLVAAGQGGGGDVDARGTDVVLLDDPARVVLGALDVEPEALRVGPLGDVAEDAVLPERGLQEQAVAVAVLGDVTDALLAALAGGPRRDVLAQEADRAGVGVLEADQRVDELGLAVALDTGDAHDLARVDGEGDVVEDAPHPAGGLGRVLREQTGGRRFVELAEGGGTAGEDREALDLDDGLVRDGGLGGLRRRQLAAHHQLGELAGGGLGRNGGADRRAAADDGDVVGDRQHLAQLVRDEDDGEALGLELAQVVEECVDLLRHEYGGGLVQDQDAGAAEEDLEDLHALAVGDTEVLDEDVGAHVQPVAVGDLADLLTGAAADAVQLLAAQDDVLQDREVVGEHEVLVHHADAAGDGVGGAVEGDLLTVDGDRALVRLLHAVEDLHQCRLPGAVLTDEGVDRALPDSQVDVVVGHHTGETLGDPRQLDRGRLRGERRAAGRVDGALSLEKGPIYARSAPALNSART